MCDALERLKDLTYAIEHNPNCPSPYLVRLVGTSGHLDKISDTRKTKDILGYGKTLDQAITQALVQKQADDTFDKIMSNPDGPNAKIILAYRP
ncbi:MAG: hypothetical protein V4681_02475 [Patescibacteria group bacterium]